MTSLEVLTALAPEVGARADAATFLSLAAGRMTASAWGGAYQQAACLLAAHMATLAPLTAAASAASAATAGPYASRATQDRSDSYGSASAGVAGLTAADASLMSTRYGRQYLELRATRAAVAPAAIRSFVLA